MNKRLPYEEYLAKQLNDLPLPDENMAWAEMKRRLEKDDKDRFTPFWLRGCFLWILFGILLFSLGWWIVRPGKWFEKKKTGSQEMTITNQLREKEQENLMQKKEVKQNPNLSFKTKLKKQDNNTRDHPEKITDIIKRKESPINRTTKNSLTGQSILKTKMKRSEQVKPGDVLLKNKKFITKTKPGVNKNNTDTLQCQNSVADSAKAIADQSISIAKTNMEKKIADSLKQETEMKEKKRNSSKLPKFSFAVGISLQQQLPVNGQKFVPYNLEGRRGSLADYIPSVYIRLYRKNNWFIQSEFRYGAPQYAKEFLYKQDISMDTSQTLVTTTSTRLKKTYYHQLPLTFNYFVSKNLSVGGGFIWNRFVSAISAQDIIQHNNLTGADSIISKETILHSKLTDSANVFVNSYFQVLLEAQYKRERFSLGAKYAVGLQPYIRFILPGGVSQQEKNSSIILFLRYELWRSKEK